jgi:hypothetical protein
MSGHGVLVVRPVLEVSMFQADGPLISATQKRNVCGPSEEAVCFLTSALFFNPVTEMAASALDGSEERSLRLDIDCEGVDGKLMHARCATASTVIRLAGRR